MPWPEVFLFPTTCSPALGFSQTHIRWTRGAFLPELSRPSCAAKSTVFCNVGY